ncbi:hypothetical protein [Burkholderia gladioli]|uniref:hypothetical protein n=1 Tax=Burkholderia gladioli TaxID=28095 RepID=UPI00163E1C93|nr:hypothetical protein [Burkholderia gladioli]
MRYIEIIGEVDLQKQQVDAQKKAAKRATRTAKAADLRLKMQKAQQQLAKLNSKPI